MDNFWSEFLQNVLMGVGVPLAVSGIFFLIAWGKKMWAEAKALKPDLMEQVERIAMLVVDAAEQAGVDAIIEDKLKYATDLAEKYLAQQGITVDLDIMIAEIRAAVKAMKANGGELQSMKSLKKAGK